MTLTDIAFIFNRALSLTFSKKKCLLVFVLLALAGLFVVFFHGLAFHAGEWVRLSLTFLPIFLCGGILLGLGILLIRIYHHEIKKREFSYSQIAKQSLELILGATYFAIPIILCYLILWLLLGVFVLLGEIPGIGPFFNVILSFAPFLINLGTLVLCWGSLLLLFFIAPIIALRGMDQAVVLNLLLNRLKGDYFSNGLLLAIALVPMITILIFLFGAAWMTGHLYFVDKSSVQNILSWFFIMLPFTAVMTPAVIFFFNFAAEAHVLVQKSGRVD